MITEPAIDRVERWHEYATAAGIPIDRILVHPDDKPHLPSFYEGLPVVALGDRP